MRKISTLIFAANTPFPPTQQNVSQFDVLVDKLKCLDFIYDLSTDSLFYPTAIGKIGKNNFWKGL